MIGVAERWVAATLVGLLLSAPSPQARAGELPACSEALPFEGTVFVICTFEADKEELRLAWTAPDGKALRGFAAVKRALGLDAARVRFAMNAGMFDDQGAPIGLYVENGIERHPVNTNEGPGNFHMKPNGVFWVERDGSARVDTTEHYLALDPHPMWATQSGPMLLIDGQLHPGIAPDGPSHHIRNGVCAENHVALFAISEDPVSFGKMARFFRDTFQCKNALYLDGAISSLWAPILKREDRRTDLGPMVVVLDRQ